MNCRDYRGKYCKSRLHSIHSRAQKPHPDSPAEIHLWMPACYINPSPQANIPKGKKKQTSTTASAAYTSNTLMSLRYLKPNPKFTSEPKSRPQANTREGVEPCVQSLFYLLLWLAALLNPLSSGRCRFVLIKQTLCINTRVTTIPLTIHTQSDISICTYLVAQPARI